MVSLTAHLVNSEVLNFRMRCREKKLLRKTYNQGLGLEEDMDRLQYISRMNVVVVRIRTVIRRFKSQNVGDKCSGVNVEGMEEPTFLSNVTNIPAFLRFIDAKERSTMNL